MKDFTNCDVARVDDDAVTVDVQYVKDEFIAMAPGHVTLSHYTVPTDLCLLPVRDIAASLPGKLPEAERHTAGTRARSTAARISQPPVSVRCTAEPLRTRAVT